jgi:Flp pilus assembly secretin CpaC
MTADIAYLFIRRAASLAALVALWAAPAWAQGTTTVEVVIDQATIVTISDRTATVVVGNTLIADVSIQGGATMVVTGKGYGITNVILLDRAGKPIAERLVRVRSPADNVVVYRGNARESYSCMPYCERRVTLGDDKEYFDRTIGQIGDRNKQGGEPH